MGLGNQSNNRVLLGIAHGKVTRKIQGQDTPETFDFIDGHLTSIGRRTAEVKGVPTEFLDLGIEDGGTDYRLSTQLTGGIARGLILSLASVQNFRGNRIRIIAYPSRDGRHTNTLVVVNGQRVSWVTSNLPPVKEKAFGGRVIKDDSERVAFVTGFVDVIQRRLEDAAATPQAMMTDEMDEFGDMPEGDE